MGLQKIPIPKLHPCTETYTQVTSQIINIMNDGYPRHAVSKTECYLNVTISAPIKILFYDVHFTSKEHSDCPIRFRTPREERCAEVGNSIYPDMEIFPPENKPFPHTIPLDIMLNESVTKMWFWLQITSM